MPRLNGERRAVPHVSHVDATADKSGMRHRRGDEIKPNQEMVGIGGANIAAGLFQGFAVSTSGSRTAVAEQSGAKSQVAGVVGAALVAVLLLLLNSLLADLPQTALAAVVIVAAVSLMDLGILRRYLRVRRSAFAVSLAATAGVILLGVLQGIVVAVVLAIALFFRRNWWPHGAILGKLEGDQGWHDVASNPLKWPKTRPALPRTSSIESGFFFCGMMEEPVATASLNSRKPNSTVE